MAKQRLGERKDRTKNGDADSPKSTTNPTTTPPNSTDLSSRQAKKKQKRDDYRAAAAVSADTELPRKKFYRQRAHANPFSDHQLVYPVSPQAMDWSAHYPAFVDKNFTVAEDVPPRMTKQVEVADIGCGFGGLLTALAPLMPDTLILGLEIRVSVAEYVSNKIRALRQQQVLLRQGKQIPATLIPVPEDGDHDQNPVTAPPPQDASPAPETANTTLEYATNDSTHPNPQASPTRTPPPHPIPGAYTNISALRSNTMKFLPNLFSHHQLHSIYLLYPDPHFKARKHKARIVSSTLCSEYAYVLRPGGIVYTVTDVQDLHEWMEGCFGGSRAFERVEEGVLREGGDVGVGVVRGETEEGRKVERVGGAKWAGFWRRVADPAWPGEEEDESAGGGMVR